MTAPQSSRRPVEPSRPAAARADLAAESARLRLALDEVSKRIVGQDVMVERLLVGLLTGGHILLEGVPGLAKTLAVRTLAEIIHATFSRIQFTPDLLPADVIGTMVFDQKTAGFPRQEGPALRADHPGRRDQPRARQGAGRAARGDAGAPGHHRRHHVSARGAVPGARHPESDRERGHLSAARGAARPLHAQGAGAAIPRRDEEKEVLLRMSGGQEIPVERAARSGRDPRGPRHDRRRCTWTRRWWTTSSTWCAPRATPAPSGSPSSSRSIAFGASPRASIALAQAARAHAFLRGRRLRRPRGRPRARARRAAPPHRAHLRGGSGGRDQRRRRDQGARARLRVP